MARRALVTGGNRGIGRAIAAGLAERGDDVVIACRDLAEGRSVAEGMAGRAVGFDLRQPESIDRAVAEVGDVDILVNNAGVIFSEPMLPHPRHFEETMAVMVAGPYHLIRLCALAKMRNGFGRIVNVSSGWGSFAEGLAGPAAYDVAKVALNALTLVLSRELPGTIKINAMCPGWVRTRMGGSSATLSPEEGADTALWLATLPDDGPSGGFFRDRQAIDW